MFSYKCNPRDNAYREPRQMPATSYCFPQYADPQGWLACHPLIYGYSQTPYVHTLASQWPATQSGAVHRANPSVVTSPPMQATRETNTPPLPTTTAPTSPPVPPSAIPGQEVGASYTKKVEMYTMLQEEGVWLRTKVTSLTADVEGLTMQVLVEESQLQGK
jgi:hypothetical protein